MIPANISRGDVIRAISDIQTRQVPAGRESRKFQLIYDGRGYPPKYVISVANRFANGSELDSSEFITHEANRFLRRLGFIVIEVVHTNRPTHKSALQKPAPKEAVLKHDERCPECKKTIGEMLVNIYGSVKSNYKFDAGARLEDYSEFWRYADLQKIFHSLQNYRGYKDFVRTQKLPPCDFFVPDPGFIVEFDESQHFTTSRKLSLLHYPDDLWLGFSRQIWIGLCDRIQARDNDPQFRDEQRAWYDTLRDFLPDILGLGSTVRLYSREREWCSLNPGNKTDVATFKNLIESRRAGVEGDFVATVTLQSNSNVTNNERSKALDEIVAKVLEMTNADGIILFPGGYYNAGVQEANTLFHSTEKQVSQQLRNVRRNIVGCLGIDGREGKDQIAIAISKDGLKAIGRKFCAAPQEQGRVCLATNYLSTEAGYSRIFTLNGRRCYLAACYDSFGISRENIANPGVDVIFDCVHGFSLKGRGSGYFYFVKFGFAGASRQWNCPVFGAAVFFGRTIPEASWLSGVYWNQGSKSLRKFKCTDNPVRENRSLVYNIPEGKALIGIYNVASCFEI